MTSTDASSHHTSYLNALQEICKITEDRIAPLMSHHGERGRIAEEIFQDFLRKLLPTKFSLGSGVIISRTGDQSSQTDIIIYDHFSNAPLLTEYTAGIFPIECVYATIEVKTNLNRRNLKKSISDISKIRNMSKSKQYVTHTVVIKKGMVAKAKGGKVKKNVGSIVATAKYPYTIPPRSLVFAFKQADWKKATGIKNYLEKQLTNSSAYLHGLYVLRDKWFYQQEAYQTPPNI